MFTRRPPSPPSDVTIRRTDGTLVPVELAYGGRRFDWRHLAWNHEWIVTVPVHGVDLRSLSVGTLPGRTSLTVRVMADLKWLKEEMSRGD